MNSTRGVVVRRADDNNEKLVCQNGKWIHYQCVKSNAFQLSTFPYRHTILVQAEKSASPQRQACTLAPPTLIHPEYRSSYSRHPIQTFAKFSASTAPDSGTARVHNKTDRRRRDFMPTLYPRKCRQWVSNEKSRYVYLSNVPGVWAIKAMDGIPDEVDSRFGIQGTFLFPDTVFIKRFLGRLVTSALQIPRSYTPASESTSLIFPSNKYRRNRR